MYPQRVVVQLDLEVVTRAPHETPRSPADHHRGPMLRMDNRVPNVECPRRFGYV